MKFLVCIVIILSMLFLVFSPERYIPIAFDGIKLWAINVLPSLFPFFFFTLLLTKFGSPKKLCDVLSPITNKLFRSNGIIGYVFTMSILSGYPVGAKLIAEIYEKGLINKDEATRASTLCSTSGPLFVIGTVGVTMFLNKECGIILFVVHFLSAVICGIIFSKFGDFNRSLPSEIQPNITDNILYESIYSSVISILCVGGFICIFFVISEIAKTTNILFALEKIISLIIGKNPNAKEIAHGFIYGLIECTAGCKNLARFPCPLSAAMSCALISFGGISVIFQSIIYLLKAGVNIKIFILSKAIQMLISFVLALLVFVIFNIF